MTVRMLLRRPDALLPIAMSFGAAAMVAWYVASYGTTPQSDEVAPVHLWQLLLAVQLPIVAVFALRWLPRSPRAALIVLAIQSGCAALAVAPVALLGGL